MNTIYKFAANHPKKWHLIKAFALIIPAFLLAYIAIKSDKPLRGQQDLREFFGNHYYWTLICIFIPLALPHFLGFIDKGVVKFYDKDVNVRIISTSLIYALNEIVGHKISRIAKYLQETGNQISKADAFAQIVQPEQHYGTILQQLYQLILTTAGDHTVEVVLVRISPDKFPCEYTVKYPTTIELPHELIDKDAEKSMFHHCVKKNNPVFIPDIKAHLALPIKEQFYQPTGNEDYDTGSIGCWPIFCQFTNKVEYVLSIKSSNVNIITKTDFKEKYKASIEAMASRLLLEHYLTLMKGKTI